MMAFTVIVLAISACSNIGDQNEEELGTFNPEKYAPASAEEVTNIQLDMDGDGENEQVLAFKNEEKFDGDQTRTKQYLRVLKRQQRDWVVMLERSFNNDNHTLVESLRDFEVVNFDNDEKKELYFYYAPYRAQGYGDFGVWGFKEGKFQKMTIPEINTFALPTGLAADDVENLVRSEVIFSDNGMVESYQLPCRQQNRESEAEPIEYCGTYSWNLLYDNGSFVRELPQ